MSRDKNPKPKNLHTVIKIKLSYHSNTIFFGVQKKTEENKNDKKYSQTGIIVKIHTNHDGVRATAIMLRSIPASLSSQSLVITVKIASEITSASLQVDKELPLISFPMH